VLRGRRLSSLGTAITLVRPFSGCAVRRGDARTVPERAVERSRCVGNEIEQCVDLDLGEVAVYCPECGKPEFGDEVELLDLDQN